MRLTGPIRHTGKWIRRHPALTALIVLAICASFGIIWQWQRAERERERAEAREVIPALIAALRDRTAQFAHVLVDTTYWKSFVHSGLATAMSDRGCISLYGTARTNHALFAEHVARPESWVEVTGPYGTVREWSWLPTRPDNHWLDCMVGCAVAASMLGVRVPGQDAKPVRNRKRYTQEDLRRR